MSHHPRFSVYLLRYILGICIIFNINIHDIIHMTIQMTTIYITYSFYSKQFESRFYENVPTRTSAKSR